MFLSLLIALFCMSIYIRHVQCSPVPNGGNGHFGDVLADVKNYIRNNAETVAEIIHTDEAITEGDMIMPPDRNALELIWAGGADGKLSIPYVISPDIDKRKDNILKAMELVSEHTCVCFHKRTTERDYLSLCPSKGCASYVGFQGGEQKLFIGPMCSDGNIAHELLHALGFHHEHTREDRDEHISVIKNNVMQGMGRNFIKRKGETFGLPYDSISILHYGGHFFSKNGLATITVKKNDGQMGQRSHMTPLDIKRVRLLYKCDEREKDQEEAKRKNRPG